MRKRQNNLARASALQTTLSIALLAISAISQLCKSCRLSNSLRYASSLALALLFVLVSPLPAADVTWNNGAGTSVWNLIDMNWNAGVWNNANADGAIFDATGAGSINVTSPINVDSMNLIASGYSFNGTGPLTFVDGTSTLASGIINVDTHFNATINTPIKVVPTDPSLASFTPANPFVGTIRSAGFHDSKDPMLHQFNFDIQFQLTPTILLDTSYSGAIGRDLSSLFINQNQIPFAQALKKYGSDKPDLRNTLEMQVAVSKVFGPLKEHSYKGITTVEGATPDVQLNEPGFANRWLDLKTGQPAGS